LNTVARESFSCIGRRFTGKIPVLHKMKKTLTQIGIILPIFFYILMLFTYAVNVPWMDDTDVFPDFLGKFLSTQNLDEQLRLIFNPNNEHRVVYAKILTLSHYAITGTLNMKTLTILSNVTLLGMLWLFWKVVKDHDLPLFYFLPIPLFLLQPQYYLTSLWSITGLQHQPVIFFGLLGMYLLSRNTHKTFFMAMIVVFLNSFTMSNGLFYWIVGMIILALQGRYKILISWIILAVITFKVYFYQFNQGANSEGFDYFFKNPHESFFGFFTYLGGSFDFMTTSPILIRSIIPTIAGFILVIISLIWVFWKGTGLFFDKFSIKKYWEKLQIKFNQNPSNYIILGCFLFLIINASIIAILRPRFGYFVMLVGNYKIYPALFLSVVYLIFLTGLLKFQTNQKIFKWILVGSIIFNIFSYLKFLPEAHERRKDLLVRIFNQEHNQIGLGPIVGSDFDRYVQTALGRLIPNGIYQYPKSIFKNSEKEILSKLPDNQSVRVNIYKNNTELFIANKDLSMGLGLNDGIYLLLKSAKKNYLIYQKRNINDFFEKGIAIQIPPNYLVPDNYQVGIFWVNGDTRKVFNAKQSVEVNY
jgi:hypothetical protein